jgi:acetyl/propionyl-CoA carboxylase alpha subunit
MRYHAIIRGQEHLVEVVAHGNGHRVRIHPGADERSGAAPVELDVDAVHLGGMAVSLLAGGKSCACDVEPGRDGALAVLVGQEVHALEMLDERKLRMRRAGGKFSLEGPQRIDAPMPGKVTRVLVKLGDEVQEGQGILVVEAMKMENELKSPKAGKVSELHAVEGAAVEAGAKLAVIA